MIWTGYSFLLNPLFCSFEHLFSTSWNCFFFLLFRKWNLDYCGGSINHFFLLYFSLISVYRGRSMYSKAMPTPPKFLKKNVISSNLGKIFKTILLVFICTTMLTKFSFFEYEDCDYDKWMTQWLSKNDIYFLRLNKLFLFYFKLQKQYKAHF